MDRLYCILINFIRRWYMITYFKTIGYVLANVFNFKGKASRKEFWTYFSFMFTFAICVGLYSGIFEYENNASLFIFDLLVDFTFIALIVRRLRDADLTVWLGAAAFLPIVALPATIVIGCLRPGKYNWVL